MTVTFSNIQRGNTFSRPQLARIWNYSGYQALARGVVTPRNDNKIILFVTREKQRHLEQYYDELQGDELIWEGPTDHFAENRFLNPSDTGDEIHVFYREHHHSDFTYEGIFHIVSSQIFVNRPSKFVLERER